MLMLSQRTSYSFILFYGFLAKCFWGSLRNEFVIREVANTWRINPAQYPKSSLGGNRSTATAAKHDYFYQRFIVTCLTVF